MKRRHRHEFSALWYHFGPYGPQDVHLHPCNRHDGKPCDRVVIGKGRVCGGTTSPHNELWLDEKPLPSDLFD